MALNNGDLAKYLAKDGENNGEMSQQWQRGGVIMKYQLNGVMANGGGVMAYGIINGWLAS
jgi:hypothetical protein